MSKTKNKENEKAPEDVSPNKELFLAARRFLVAAEDRQMLKTLLLVDPIRAFSEADIQLSKPARKLLRRKHPEAAYGNDELYEGVKSGSIKLPWIEKIELGRPRRADDENGVDPESRKEAPL
jgi:hypothetical protein